MDKQKDEQELGLNWIPMLFMSPIAFLLLILMALLSLLRFLLKATLLFSIVAINTPFLVMVNSSILVLGPNSNFDPRVTVGIELQTFVSDFYKVVAVELLQVLSTGVITFYTAPELVFFISMAVGVTAILLKWLNSKSLSKTAFSCFCDGYGLNPLMGFFSFIGLFDIGCHPVAKCSFVASKAVLFTKDEPNRCSGDNGWFGFSGAMVFIPDSSPEPSQMVSKSKSIEFSRWDAFERGLFQLRARIDFTKENNGKNILKSFMVLKLNEKKLCKYPVERLELPEDYSEANELYNFLFTLSEVDGFVTDKMRGRYERSLTLLEIVDGVQQNKGYKIVDPMDETFVVADVLNDLRH